MAGPGGRIPPPQNGTWYPLHLGTTFSGDNSAQYYTLRYEFKPASVDPSKPGVMRSRKDKKEVAVELPNNQAGKPNVAFQGHRELCQEQEAILIFDGQLLRLERLHHSVKSLKVVRGNAKAAAEGATAAITEMQSSPLEAAGDGGRTPVATPPLVEDLKVHEDEDLLLPVSEAAVRAEVAKTSPNFKAHLSKAKLPGTVKKRKTAAVEEPPPSPPAPPPPPPKERTLSPPKPSASDEEAQQCKKPRPEDVETLEMGVEEEVVEYYETETDEEETQEVKSGGGGGVAVETAKTGAVLKTSSSSGSSASGSSASGSGSDGSSSASGSEDDSASSGDDVVE